MSFDELFNVTVSPLVEPGTAYIIDRQAISDSMELHFDFAGEARFQLVVADEEAGEKLKASVAKIEGLSDGPPVSYPDPPPAFPRDLR